MNKIRNIIRLHLQAGLSLRGISRSVGVSRPVVSYYLGQLKKSGLTWTEVDSLNDSDLERRLRPEEPQLDPRLKEVGELLPTFAQELGKQGVTRYLLWEEYRRSHPDGYSYPQFCFHLQTFKETSCKRSRCGLRI